MGKLDVVIDQSLRECNVERCLDINRDFAVDAVFVVEHQRILSAGGCWNASFGLLGRESGRA